MSQLMVIVVIYVEKKLLGNTVAITLHEELLLEIKSSSVWVAALFSEY